MPLNDIDKKNITTHLERFIKSRKEEFYYEVADILKKYFKGELKENNTISLLISDPEKFILDFSSYRVSQYADPPGDVTYGDVREYLASEIEKILEIEEGWNHQEIIDVIKASADNSEIITQSSTDRSIQKTSISSGWRIYNPNRFETYGGKKVKNPGFEVDEQFDEYPPDYFIRFPNVPPDETFKIVGTQPLFGSLDPEEGDFEDLDMPIPDGVMPDFDNGDFGSSSSSSSSNYDESKILAENQALKDGNIAEIGTTLSNYVDINFGSQELDDNDVKSLCEAISKNKNIAGLTILVNITKIEGLNSLIDIVEKNSNIFYADINSNYNTSQTNMRLSNILKNNQKIFIDKILSIVSTTNEEFDILVNKYQSIRPKLNFCCSANPSITYEVFAKIDAAIIANTLSKTLDNDKKASGFPLVLAKIINDYVGKSNYLDTENARKRLLAEKPETNSSFVEAEDDRRQSQGASIKLDKSGKKPRFI